MSLLGGEKLELRQLEYFLTVSNLKSFTKAAKASFVSQPAITNAINSLENELGIKLFDRTSRKVSLTTEGEIFYNHVGMVMKDIENARTHMNNLKRQRYGIIKIAVNQLITISHFMPVYNKYLEENVHTKITFSSCGHEQARKLIDEDDFDIAIMLGDKEEFNNNSCTKMAVTGNMSLFSKGKLDSNVDINSISDEPIAMIRGNYYFNKIVKEYLEDSLNNIVCQSDSLDIIQHMLMTKKLSALLPDFIQFKDNEIKKIPFTTKVECGIYVMWRDNLTQSIGKKFADYFLEYYNECDKVVE